MSVTLVEGQLHLSCSDIDARPLFWNDGPTRLGYEPEAAHAVGDALGIDIVWVYTPWDERWAAVAEGRADAVWCGMAVTDARREVMQFSSPYASFNESLLVRADSSVRSPADTAGLRIGAPANSTNEQLARSWPGAEVVPFAGYDDVFEALIEALADGSIDGFVDDEPAMVPLGDRDERFTIAFSVPTQHQWAAALRPGSDALQALIDQGISVALTSGALAGLWTRNLPFLEFPLTTTG